MVGRFHGMLHLSSEQFKIFHLLGRPHMRVVLGNHLMDQLLRLVQWLSISQSLRKTSQESIKLESITWNIPWIRSVRGVNLEG